jgi:hypothetical protein
MATIPSAIARKAPPPKKKGKGGLSKAINAAMDKHGC